MRRQARSLVGGSRIERTASALQVWLWLLIFIFQNEFRICQSIQPGYLDFDNLPETNFTCEGKVIGGYYADLETSCQMFHVCTVGQQEEPMDIKFLCLNGTVFDQETRVCERVDEVDCTKSEKFYSLNLELYGSTIAPPANKQNSTKTNEPSRSGDDDYNDPEDLPVKPNQHKVESNPEYQDTTEDTLSEVKGSQKPQDYSSVSPTNSGDSGLSQHAEPVEENQEEEEIDSEIPEYEDEYTQASPTSTPATTTTRSTTVVLPQPSAPPYPPAQSPAPPYPPAQSPAPPFPPAQSPAPPPTQQSNADSANPTLDPAQLSPQEFIYRHRGPGSEAISFQRQGFRPADGVYITHAPVSQSPQTSQFDHFQYESSRTAPRPASPQQIGFVERPVPAPFRATTTDPRNQLLRPGPAFQSSERHETSIKSRPYLPPPPPAPLSYDSYYYDRKRSDDATTGSESTLAARSVGPPAAAERQSSKLKSPPRVIVTASASVSDSNGKRLNYTVGNVVSAVKPIVPINYDDYKESDLIFDPFFLDVPKLSKYRKNRGSSLKIVHPAVVRMYADDSFKIKTTTARISSQASALKKNVQPSNLYTTTTAAWSPYDYVDDNYEAHAFVPPAPAHTVHQLNMPFDRNKLRARQSHGAFSDKINHRNHRPRSLEKIIETPPATQLSSSQYAESSAVVAASSL